MVPLFPNFIIFHDYYMIRIYISNQMEASGYVYFIIIAPQEINLMLQMTLNILFIIIRINGLMLKYVIAL